MIKALQCFVLRAFDIFFGTKGINPFRGFTVNSKGVFFLLCGPLYAKIKNTSIYGKLWELSCRGVVIGFAFCLAPHALPIGKLLIF